ncbi:MAG TPA: hypothetical protein VGN26_16615 [Armatimonadota bacterium]|jgi:hypothetical protein
MAEASTASADRELDPRGGPHIAIGIASSLDAVKTLVEAEGGFSPGLGTFGVSVWLWEADAQGLPRGYALVVGGRPVLVADRAPSAAGGAGAGTVGRYAREGQVPAATEAGAEGGDCSGALAVDLELAPGASEAFGFVCPVLAGRRAVGHRWDGVSEWATYPPPYTPRRVASLPCRRAPAGEVAVPLAGGSVGR